MVFLMFLLSYILAALPNKYLFLLTFPNISFLLARLLAYLFTFAVAHLVYDVTWYVTLTIHSFEKLPFGVGIFRHLSL